MTFLFVHFFLYLCVLGIYIDRKIHPIEFGNRQRVHRPNDECEDPDEEEEQEALADDGTCKEFVCLNNSYYATGCEFDKPLQAISEFPAYYITSRSVQLEVCWKHGSIKKLSVHKV